METQKVSYGIFIVYSPNHKNRTEKQITNNKLLDFFVTRFRNFDRFRKIFEDSNKISRDSEQHLKDSK